MVKKSIIFCILFCVNISNAQVANGDNTVLRGGADDWTNLGDYIIARYTMDNGARGFSIFGATDGYLPQELGRYSEPVPITYEEVFPTIEGPLNYHLLNEDQLEAYNNGEGEIWTDGSWRQTTEPFGDIFGHGLAVGQTVYLSQAINRNGVQTPPGVYTIEQINPRNGSIYINGQPVASQNMHHIQTSYSGTPASDNTQRFNGKFYMYYLDTSQTRAIMVNYYINIYNDYDGLGNKIMLNVVFPVSETKSKTTDNFIHAGFGNEIANFQAEVKKYGRDWQPYKIITTTYSNNPYASIRGGQYGFYWKPFYNASNAYTEITRAFVIDYFFGNSSTPVQKFFYSPCHSEEKIIESGSVTIPINYEFKIIPNYVEGINQTDTEYVFNVQENFNFTGL